MQNMQSTESIAMQPLGTPVTQPCREHDGSALNTNKSHQWMRVVHNGISKLTSQGSQFWNRSKSCMPPAQITFNADDVLLLLVFHNKSKDQNDFLLFVKHDQQLMLSDAGYLKLLSDAITTVHWSSVTCTSCLQRPLSKFLSMLGRLRFSLSQKDKQKKKSNSFTITFTAIWKKLLMPP